jgi:hypothetical protein
MGHATRRQVIIGLLLGATGLGGVLYVCGLASTLRLGDANIQGFLLVPALPTPLYVTMAFVVCAGVGLTLVASFVQRRRQPPEPQQQRVSEPVRSPWQMLISMLSWGALLFVGMLWLIRHGDDLRQWLERWSLEFRAAPDLLAAGTRSLLRQVDSPTTGYALFTAVVVIYGGLALLALWVLVAGRQGAILPQESNDSHTRRVRRAVTAGLRELQQHPDPRQAIIACYARLEHLLEDHGVPAYRHLTPQEYMGVALQGLDLPMEAFASLVALFEQARYSVHPLDNTARQTAITHLETIKTHLEWETALATRA